MIDGRPAYASIGTSAPIFIPSTYPPDPVKVGSDYFSIRICAAQVAFVGSIWTKVNNVLVSSQVNLHYPTLGDRSLRSLQQTRAVKPRADEQLGLAVNLVDLTPAVMPQVAIALDFHLDKENRLAKLGSLVNKESFSAALSLAPGSIVIAKTISALAEDIITTFIPAEEQEPILQFSGDFNLSTDDLRAGYYAILGTRDADHPIPAPLPSLAFREGRLHGDGYPLSGLSYVVFEVRKTSARTRDTGVGSDWDARLREAEDIAQNLIDEARRSAWEKCRNLIREAQTFLRSDSNFLRTEGEQIARATYLRCRDLVLEPVHERSGRTRVAGDSPAWLPDDRADRAYLNIGADEDLDAQVFDYASEVMKAREILSDWESNG
jgi:hypothetical protein